MPPSRRVPTGPLPGAVADANGPLRSPTSLRARFTLWYGVALGVTLVVFAAVGYAVFARTLVRRADRFIVDALSVFEREVGAERKIRATPLEAVTTTAAEVRFRNVRIVVRDARGALISSGHESDGGVGGDGDPLLVALLAAPIDTVSTTLPWDGGGERVLSRHIAVGSDSYVLTGAMPLADVTDVLARIRLMYVIAIPLLLAASAAGAWLLATRGLAPVDAMVAQAREISDASLYQRLPVGGAAELSGLARVFNELLDRLEGAFAQQRRFMADASHELRTPTSIIRAEAEVTLSREVRTEAEYRESIGVMLLAVKRLTRIVDDLFLLARADAGHLTVRRQPIYLEEVVHDATRGIEQVGEQRGVKVELRSMTQAPFQGDPDLLGRLLLNLLDNAIKHSPVGGTVAVEMAERDGQHAISVIDEGPGIPQEDAERVFERFFRGDAARVRPAESVTDGAGLGLAIARRIAEAHGGTLRLASSGPGRTEFELRLPVLEAAAG